MTAENDEAEPHQDLSHLSPMQSLVGDPQSLKILRNGTMLIEAQLKSQSRKVDSFMDIDTEVTPHRFLNYSRGIIRSSDFRNVKESDMVDDLSSYKAIAAQQI